MSEFVNKRREQFTILSNAALRDPRLSLKAKGLLALLLSFPDDWTYHLAHIESLSTDGREATRNALREIEQAGYVIRTPRRGQDGGKLAGWCYEVSGFPSDGETVSRENRQTVQPTDGKPAATKTDSTKTDKNKDLTPPTPQRGAEAGEPQEQHPAEEPDARPAAPQAPTGTEAEGGDPPASPDNAPTPQGHETATSTEEVPPGGAARRERREASEREALALVETWNDHRGALPEVQALSEGRRRAATKLLRDCGWDLDRARATLADATREIAADDWWTSRKLGFDVLMPAKVQGKAEAWRARHTSQPPAAPRRRTYA